SPPSLSLPQQIAWSARTPHAARAPNVIAVHVASPLTCVAGTTRSVPGMIPSPALPQHHSWPLVASDDAPRIAHERLKPAATAGGNALGSPGTDVGTGTVSLDIGCPLWP